MQERVESLGGSIKITSGLGKGTLIEVALPLPQGVTDSAGAPANEDSAPAVERTPIGRV
jgi:signal transduction histidine kinase